ncbi:MAG: nucleotidyltransferase family protein [Conexivisphaera sp.]
MRAIIMAGGFARRMWPLTSTTPKQLLPLAEGYVILDLVVDGLLEIDLEEIILSVNAKFSDAFRRWLSSRGLNIQLIEEPSRSEEEKPGAVGALHMMLGSLPRDDYLIVAGDNVTSIRYSELVGTMMSHGAPTIALYDVGSIELARRYGVVELGPDSRVISLIEKPEDPPSTLISTAIYAMPWRSLSRIEEYLASGGSRDAIGHFISWLVRAEPVYGFRFNGFWFDVGSVDEYNRVRELFSQGVIERPRHVALSSM